MAGLSLSLSRCDQRCEAHDQRSGYSELSKRDLLHGGEVAKRTDPDYRNEKRDQPLDRNGGTTGSLLDLAASVCDRAGVASYRWAATRCLREVDLLDVDMDVERPVVGFLVKRNSRKRFPSRILPRRVFFFEPERSPLRRSRWV